MEYSVDPPRNEGSRGVERSRDSRSREGKRDEEDSREKRERPKVKGNIREQNDTMIGRAVYREPLPYSHERLFPVAARPIVCIRSKFYYS